MSVNQEVKPLWRDIMALQVMGFTLFGHSNQPLDMVDFSRGKSVADSLSNCILEGRMLTHADLKIRLLRMAA